MLCVNSTHSMLISKHFFDELLVFQPDGALPHFAVLVRQFLDETFDDGLATSVTGFNNPRHSFVVILGNKIYAIHPESPDNFQRIENQRRQLDSGMLINVRETFQNR